MVGLVGHGRELEGGLDGCPRTHFPWMDPSPSEQSPRGSQQPTVAPVLGLGEDLWTQGVTLEVKFPFLDLIHGFHST